ncbi:hypothetical protein BJY59DRAFT_686514 [Rhodotorula toruloides]
MRTEPKCVEAASDRMIGECEGGGGALVLCGEEFPSFSAAQADLVRLQAGPNASITCGPSCHASPAQCARVFRRMLMTAHPCLPHFGPNHARLALHLDLALFTIRQNYSSPFRLTASTPSALLPLLASLSNILYSDTILPTIRASSRRNCYDFRQRVKSSAQSRRTHQSRSANDDEVRYPR